MVKVLEEIINSVVSGFRSASVAPRWAPSTFDTKWTRGPPRANGRNALHTVNGPRSEPPIPMLTTWVKGLPVIPCIVPPLIASEKARTRSRMATTSGMTSCPSTQIGWFDRLRKATCKAARLSVVLTRRPSNIAAICSPTFDSAASAVSSCRVSLETGFLEKSRIRPAASRQ